MQETRRRVVAALREGPVAGPALADSLGVSRAAVWNHVEALREEGFDVVDGPDGYELRAVPEYGAGALAYELDDLDLEFHEELASTNARARELAVAGAAETLVVAARQTGGRGRLDRAWDSPEGGIYASLLCRPDVPPAHAPAFTLAAAVAVADAAHEVGVDAGIKWPNDVLVPAAGTPPTDRAGGASEPGGEPKKLAGILTEMEGEADRVSWLVVGVGVNVNTDPADLPTTATSVAAEVGPVTRREFLATVVERFRDLAGDAEAVLPAWRERALTLGRAVRVDTPSGTVEGTAVDVEFPGTLVIETDEGSVRVTAGDCEHLRPR